MRAVVCCEGDLNDRKVEVLFIVNIGHSCALA
jgi:hypothetical protein